MSPRPARRILLLALLAAVARAGTPPDKPAQAADKVLAAVEAMDAGALRELAAQDDPDPWLVADELLFRGQPDAALAFARAAPRKDVAALPACIESRRGVPYDREARAAFDEATRLLDDAAKPAEALARLDRSGSPGDVFLRTRLTLLRGKVLRALGRARESAESYGAAADPARGLGWIRGECSAWANVAISLREGGIVEGTLEACARQMALAEERGVPKAIAQAHVNTGSSLRAAGRFDEAIAALERGGEIYRKLGNTEGLAYVLNHLGLVHWECGERARERERYTEALALFESIHCREGIGIAALNAGRSALGAGDFTAAIPLLERAIEVKTEVSTALEKTRLHFDLTLLASAYKGAGRLEEAFDRASRALAICEKAGLSREAIAILTLLVDLCDARGDASGSALHARRAVELAEPFADLPALANLLVAAAIRERCAEEFSAARSSLERAIRIGEQREDPALISRAVGLLLECLNETGEFDAAVAAGEAALPILRSAPDHRLPAAVLRFLGTAYVGQGRWAEAIAAGREALRLAEEMENPVLIGVALRALAESYARTGDDRIAKSLLERNLRIEEQRNEPRDLIDSLTRLALARNSCGDAEGARRLLDRAVGIVESGATPPREWVNVLFLLSRALRASGEHRHAIEVLGRLEAKGWLRDQWHARSKIHGLLASCHFSVGDTPAALRHAEQAIEACQGRCGDCEVAALDVLRDDAESRGDHARALDLAERAVRLKGRGGRAPATALHRTALLLWPLVEAGRWTDAIRTGRELVEQLGVVVEVGSEEAGLSCRQLFHCSLAAAALASRRAGDVDATCFFYEAGRAGLLLDALAVRDAAASAVVPAALVGEERRARARLSSAFAAAREAERSADAAGYDAARRAMEEVREEWLAVLASGQKEARMAAHVAFPTPDPLSTIQGRLRPNDALVLYSTSPCRAHAKDAGAAALVITPDSARVVTIGTTEEIDAACIAAIPDAPGTDRAKEVAALRRLVIDPLRLDAKVTRLLVSPEGLLFCVPFVLLAPEREVVFVPSGTAYGVLLSEREKRGEGVLALGDPDYGAEPPPDPLGIAEVRRSAMALVPLPASAEEARSVGTEVLLGKSATSTALQNALATRPRWRAVHVACHASIDAEQPAVSALALTPGDADDGLLTALDVMKLRVPADLVVLSACETSLGGLVGGEGMVGLTRAFMVAGAPRVLASLWKVDDAATLAFMKAFYASWNSGRSPAAALREAQAEVRSEPKWSHPRYWAAWVLWGLGD